LQRRIGSASLLTESAVGGAVGVTIDIQTLYPFPLHTYLLPYFTAPPHAVADEVMTSYYNITVVVVVSLPMYSANKPVISIAARDIPLRTTSPTAVVVVVVNDGGVDITNERRLCFHRRRQHPVFFFVVVVVVQPPSTPLPVFWASMPLFSSCW
jgi:hypothetical protein